MDGSGSSPVPRIALSIGVGPGQSGSLRGARHRQGVSAGLAWKGNRYRDIRTAYGSAEHDRNSRRITTFALRQVIGWADERVCRSGKCRSRLRKV